MSGLYSLVAGDWWEDALAAVGLERSQLPTLVDVGTVSSITAETAARFGLPAGLPLVFAGNDQTAGAFGAGVEAAGTALVTLGTAQVVYRVTAGLPPAQPGVIRGLYPAGSSGSALGYEMVADGCGGNLVTWAQRLLQFDPADGEAFFRVATAVSPGCDGVTFSGDPAVGGGAWSNLGLHHTSGHLARSLLEFLCLRLKDHLQTLGHSGPLLVAGGGARSAVWPDLIAAICGCPLQRVSAGPLDGAAAMARQALTGSISHQ